MSSPVAAIKASNAARIAAILEASVDKPGNVSPEHDFVDTTYNDFLLGSYAIGDTIGLAAKQGDKAKIGELIKRGVLAVKDSHSGGNTHLGILLLMVPVAASYFCKGALEKNVKKILKNADVEETLAFYEAVKISGANVGTRKKLREPRIPFHEMLCNSAVNDRIAQDLVSELRITRFTERVIRRNFSDMEGNIRSAILQSYLELLAAYPDTLIAKKCGREKAEEVSLRAEKIVELGGVKTKEGLTRMRIFDDYLGKANNNELNPGTTADIIAGALMLFFLRSWKRPENRAPSECQGRGILVSGKTKEILRSPALCS